MELGLLNYPSFVFVALIVTEIFRKPLKYYYGHCISVETNNYVSLKLIDLLQRLSSKKILNCLKMKKSLIFNSDLQVIKGRPLTNQKNVSVDLIVMYKNQEKTITEEILVYDTPTMISQIGGILSLFLGFSFFSIICDVMELIQIKMK